MHFSFLHLPDLVQLKLDLIIIIVFFLALAFGAKRKMVNIKEVLWIGAVLVVATAMLIYPICVKQMIETIGYGQRAFLWAAAPVLTLVVALVWALRIIIQHMEDPIDPTRMPPRRRPSKEEQAKQIGPPVAPPKPQRSHGGKRRF